MKHIKQKCKKIITSKDGSFTFPFGLSVIVFFILLFMVIINGSLNISSAYIIKKQIKQEVALFNASITVELNEDMITGNFNSYQAFIENKKDRFIEEFKQKFEQNIPKETETRRVSNLSISFESIETDKCLYVVTCDIDIISTMFGKEYLKNDNVKIKARHSFKNTMNEDVEITNISSNNKQYDEDLGGK